MERTTKKKKSKALKRRIGIIAIGGLSFVLTICLSVGATMAWFAGSTYASNTMYMGGPVYVEMAGRGAAAGTAGDGTSTAKWVGGNGHLDIVAAARSTGTVNNGTEGFPYGQILLPGQKLMVYSQARVFSTNETTTVADNPIPSQNSGANTTNTANGTATYQSLTGRVTTTTTSILRAKFSINVEFDPSVGINNFTQASFVYGYPINSTTYIGDGTDGGSATSTTVVYDAAAEATNKYFLSTDASSHASGGYETAEAAQAAAQGANAAKFQWYAALDATPITGNANGGTFTGRRDAVASCDRDSDPDLSSAFYESEKSGTPTSDATELMNIKKGLKSSIYEWKFVSQEEYMTTNYQDRMAAPFDGTINSAGQASNTGKTEDPSTHALTYTTNQNGSGNGFYGVWVKKNNAYVESNAFFKARTKAYLNSYREHYVDEYERSLVMGYELSLTKLEDSLNNSFVDLVNQSSDNIIGGWVNGFTVSNTGVVTRSGSAHTWGGTDYPSWLYVDPSVAPDTNSSAGSTSVGGWWYLVSSSSGMVTRAQNTVNTVKDVVTYGTESDVATAVNNPEAGTAFKRAGAVNGVNPENGRDTVYSGGTSDYAAAKGWGYSGENPAPASATIVANTDDSILYAKLYEITPQNALSTEVIGRNGNKNIVKTVSVSFPFVNGSFELPGKELTNNFANAKITFQITFQALQAFLPYTKAIDNLHTGNALLGTAHALNIGNAVPIFNEAFDYLAYL